MAHEGIKAEAGLKTSHLVDLMRVVGKVSFAPAGAFIVLGSLPIAVAMGYWLALLRSWTRETEPLPSFPLFALPAKVIVLPWSRINQGFPLCRTTVKTESAEDLAGSQVGDSELI